MTFIISNSTDKIPPSSISHSISSSSNQSIDTAKSEHCLNNPSKKMDHFLPHFSKGDQIAVTLYQYGIIDKNGHVCPKFNQKKFPILNLKLTEDRKVWQKIRDYLCKARQLHIELPSELEKLNLNDSFEISIDLTSLFKHLVHYASKQQNFPIDEVILAGKTVLELLEADYFCKASLLIFKVIEDQEPGLIQSWFTNQTPQKGSDDDFRIQTQGELTNLQDLTNETLKFLTKKLKNFSSISPLYVNQLAQINSIYKKLTSLEDIKMACIREFKGITKRNDIFDQENQFTILGLKIKDGKDLDLVFINRLKKDHLFDRDCLKIPLKKTFFSEQNTSFLHLDCTPFTAAEYLVSILTKKCSIFKHELIDEAHFLKFITLTSCHGDCLNELNPQYNSKIDINLEKDLVIKFLNHKRVFLIEKSSKRKKIIKKEADISDSYYIYSILKEYIQKHHLKQPLTVIALTYNACQLIRNHSPVSDEEFKKIWQKMGQKGLFNFDELPSENAFYSCLKRLLIKDEMPFSEVASWLQLYTFIFSPQSLTKHNGKPAFSVQVPCSQQPHYFLLPFQPIEAIQNISKLLETANESKPVYDLYVHFTAHMENNTQPFPLAPYLEHLNLNLLQLTELAKTWIKQKDPFISYLGSQLYLTLPDLIVLDSTSFLEYLTLIVKNFPSILGQQINLQKEYLILSNKVKNVLFTHFDNSTWMTFAKNCIYQHHPLISHFGAQLYLDILDIKFSLENLSVIFYHFPSIVNHSNTIIDQINFLNCLQSKLEKEKQELISQAISSVTGFIKQGKPLTLDRWMNTLVYSQHPTLILWAYQLFKKEIQQGTFNKKTGLNILNILRFHYPLQSIQLLNSLFDYTLKMGKSQLVEKQLTLEEKIRSLILICQILQKKNVTIDLTLLYPLVDHLLKLEDIHPLLDQKQYAIEWSRSLTYITQELLQNPNLVRLGDDILFRASKKNYLLSSDLFKVWLSYLEQRLAQNHSFAFSILFKFAQQNGFLKAAEQDQERLHTLQVQAIQILQNNQGLLGQELLASLIDEATEPSLQQPIGSILLSFLKQTIKQKSFNSITLPLLEKCLRIHLPQNQLEIKDLLNQCFECISHSTFNAFLDQKFISEFDQILLITQVKSLLKNYKNHIGSYLAVSLRFSHQSRFPYLWNLFELLAFSDSTPSERSILLIKILQQAQSFGISLPQSLQIKIQDNQLKILNSLQHDHQSTIYFLLALDHFSIPRKETASYSLHACQSLAKEAKIEIDQILKILNKESATDLIKLLTPKDFPFLKQLIIRLLALSHPSIKQLKEAANWIEICFKIDCQSQFQQELNNLILSCCSTFIKFYYFQEAYPILFLYKASTKGEDAKASLSCLKIITGLQKSHYSKLTEQVLLHSFVQNLYKKDPSCLKFFIEYEIFSLLSQNSTHAISLALQLFKAYQIVDAILWKSIWQNLSERLDKELISSTWQTFKQVQKELTGKQIDIATCWKFALKNLKNSQNIEILSFLDNEDFLDKIFPNEEDALDLLKIEIYLFILMGSISQISSDKLNLSETILNKKLWINQFYQERQQPYSTKSDEISLGLDILHWEVTSALANKLSTFPIDRELFTACTLLQDLLDNKTKQTKPLLLIQLLEQGITTYAIISPDLIKTDENETGEPKIELTDTLIHLLNTAFTSFFHTRLDNQIDIQARNQSFTKIVSKLLNHHSIFILEVVGQILGELIDEISHDQLSNLKTIFINFISHSIKTLPPAHFDIIDKCLEKGINKLPLSLKEKSNLCGPYMKKLFASVVGMCNQSVSKKIPHQVENEDEGIEMGICLTIETYIKLFPYLIFSNQDMQNDFLMISADFINYYANFKSSQEVGKFNKYFEDVLQVWYQTIKTSKYNTHLEWYLSNFLSHMMSEANVVNLAPPIFYQFINKLIEAKEDKKLVLYLIELFIYLLPPSLDFRGHPNLAKKLTIKADKYGYFQKNNSLLIEFYHYHEVFGGDFIFAKKIKDYKDSLHSAIINQQQLIVSEKEQKDFHFYNYHYSKCSTQSFKEVKPKLLKIWNHILKYITPVNIYRAVKNLEYLYGALIKDKDTEQLKTCYDQLLKIIKENPIFCSNSYDKSSLLDHLLTAIIPKNGWTAYTGSISSEMLKELFNVIYDATEKTWSIPSFHVPNLKLMLKILDHYFQAQAFSKNYSYYLTLIEKMIPFLKEVVIQEVQVHHSFLALITEEVDFTLTKQLIKLITNEPNFKDKTQYKIQQVSLFAKWINELYRCSTTPDSFPGKIREHILVCFYEGIHQNIFNDGTQEFITLFEKLKNWMITNEKGYIYFALEVIHLEFYKHKYNQEPLLFFERVKKINAELIHEFSTLVIYDFEIPLRLVELCIKTSPNLTVEAKHVQQEAYCLLVKIFQVNMEHNSSPKQVVDSSLATDLQIPSEIKENSDYLLNDPEKIQIIERSKEHLIYLVVKGLEAEIFKEDYAEAVDLMQEIQRWLTINANPEMLIVLNLLNLTFHAPSLVEQDYAGYCQKLENLIPSLKDIVIKNDDIIASQCFVKALSYQPLSTNSLYENKRSEIFIDWLEALLPTTNRDNTDKTFIRHIAFLFKDASDWKIIDATARQAISDCDKKDKLKCSNYYQKAKLFERARQLSNLWLNKEEGNE